MYQAISDTFKLRKDLDKVYILNGEHFYFDRSMVDFEKHEVQELGRGDIALLVPEPDESEEEAEDTEEKSETTKKPGRPKKTA